MARIYIAGKITGLSGEEAEVNFMWAEMLIEKAGHTPLNPLKLVDQAEGREYGEYLLDALRVVLLDAEALFMLDNWPDSKGARIELAIAHVMDLPVYYKASELPIGSDWPEVKEV